MRRDLFALVLVWCWLFQPAAAAAEVLYTAKDLRDPFSEKKEVKKVERPIVPDLRLQSMTIQGLMLSDENAHAIINGKIYKVGQMIEGWKISKIDKDGVTATFGERTTIIPQSKRKLPNAKKATPSA